MRFSAVSTGLVLACGLMLPGVALAQNAARPGAPAQATDIKPIGDWTVRCFAGSSTSPCDMYEELDDKESHQRILSVSIAYIPSADKHVIQIAVPLGISIPKGVVIQADKYTSAVLPYRRCDQAGCYVEMILPNDVIDSLSHAGPKASMKIVSDDDKPFELHFSLDGFTAAHDAMTDLAKQKEKAAPAAPAAPAKK
jgi:invasion protein IalB